MPTRMIQAKPEDVRRVKIKCRCGTTSIFETLRQIARGVGLHPCPHCGRFFDITFRQGKWRIRATPNQGDGELHYTDADNVKKQKAALEIPQKKEKKFDPNIN